MHGTMHHQLVCCKDIVEEAVSTSGTITNSCVVLAVPQPMEPHPDRSSAGRPGQPGRKHCVCAHRRWQHRHDTTDASHSGCGTHPDVLPRGPRTRCHSLCEILVLSASFLLAPPVPAMWQIRHALIRVWLSYWHGSILPTSLMRCLSLCAHSCRIPNKQTPSVACTRSHSLMHVWVHTDTIRDDLTSAQQIQQDKSCTPAPLPSTSA